MKFTKMHGLGNDYVYIDCMDGTAGGYDGNLLADDTRIARLSQQLSDRHRSIGGDGIILILPSDKADFRMRIFNADGSEAQMCGNGSRCVGKYVYDAGYTDKKEITLETGAGVLTLRLYVGDDNKVDLVTVDMGSPVFDCKAIPVVTPLTNSSNVDIPFKVDNEEYAVTAVSMGNPHGVIFVDLITDSLVLGKGPKLEHHPQWPERANIEFAHIISPTDIEMRVWERGSGETMACGTGACATAVAAMLTGRTEATKVTLRLPGGNLTIEWDKKSNHVFMTGPATLAFNGEVTVEI